MRDTADGSIPDREASKRTRPSARPDVDEGHRLGGVVGDQAVHLVGGGADAALGRHVQLDHAVIMPDWR